MSKTTVDKPNSQAVKLLREQERQYPGQGLLAEVRELCSQYGLPDATQDYLDPEWVKSEVKWRGMFEVWSETMKSPKVPLHEIFTDKRKYYFDKPKMEARMLFQYYVGELNFRTNRRKEAMSKFGGTQCLFGVCCGEDSLAHITECFGYRTRPPPNLREEDLSDYLLELHRERIQRWKAPLINVDVNSLLT